MPDTSAMKQVSEVSWEIPPSYKRGMNVPARIYATKKLLDAMDSGVIEQATNVACLPGIVRYAYAMADAHWGYGFPIGGVAAFDIEKGVISPGGVGFDVNCGMRLIRTNLRFSEVKPKVKELVDLIFSLVPAGVGVKGSQGFAQSQMGDITSLGVRWCAEHDLAWDDDPAHVEEGGFIKGADISKVSRQAISRGVSQFGTLGSGNHYLEIQVVDPGRYLDRELAKEFGIVHDDQVMVMIHCGSRGFGHQICSDYLRTFESGMGRFGIEVRDRDLACLPFASKEGQDYYSAMVCAANFAFVNRQIIVNKVREAFSKVFHRDADALDMHLIYDVCHNVAKVETHSYDGSKAKVLVHRKGATRSFGPGHPDLQRVLGGDQFPDAGDRAGDEAGREVEERGGDHGCARGAERRRAPGEVATPEPAQPSLLVGRTGLGREIGHRVDGLEQGPHRPCRQRRVSHDRPSSGIHADFRAA